MHLSVKARRITGTGTKDRTAVMGILERVGKVKTVVVADRKKAALQSEVKKHVEAGATLYTDALLSYEGLAGQYATRLSIMLSSMSTVVFIPMASKTSGACKRGINGTYVSIETFHLFRYLDEQSFRYNENLDDQGRFEAAMGNVFGHRLTYSALTGAATSH